MAKSELLQFPTPILAVKGAICFGCLKAANKLNKCGKCKRVFYCSTECQKKDWKKGHKALCPVLVKINSLDASTAHQTWAEYRAQLWLRVDDFRTHIPKLPTSDERFLAYEPHCSSCHRTSFQLSPQEVLKLCPTCHLAHTCSSCSPSSHLANCPTYLRVSTAEQFAINHYLETSEPTLQMPTEKPRTTYLPLSTAKNWYEYYTLISDKTMIRDIISPDLLPLVGNDEMACALTASTDKSTMILTILAALEKVLPNNLPTKTSLTLHLIGATARELDSLMLFEELVHLLPSLKTVHTIFVGPELPPSLPGSMNLDCCPVCTTSKRTRTIELFQQPYHEYAQSPSFSRPDLGVAFQTGHSQEAIESWKPTIQYLAREAGFPTVFTTFNAKELQEEVAGLKELGAMFLVYGEENRWKGMRPLLEVMEEKEGSVYYFNEFWYVIDGVGK